VGLLINHARDIIDSKKEKKTFQGYLEGKMITSVFEMRTSENN
jgi:hypothetical protein